MLVITVQNGEGLAHSWLSTAPTPVLHSWTSYEFLGLATSAMQKNISDEV